ncbi:MAG: formate/nitrite transporter family protein [Deltaproteobacteria bacterium]|jgi:formate/nitrite transporter|nr:formate/nitrite transporter family protein [Deltaproteobacteria bacterium]
MVNMKTPAETIDTVLSIGMGKARQKFSSHIILSVLAGIYIGFGAVLALKVTGNLNPAWGNIIKLLFGLTFPVGLLMVLIAGASLFTGDVMYMTSSCAVKDTNLRTWFSYLTISYIGNLIGSIFLAFLVFQSKVLFDTGPDGSLPIISNAVSLANSKTSLTFLTAFLRGILCNWLVCLAIFMSLFAQDCVSKAVLMWPPITTFVVLGMEHSVANMCFIPLGIFLGKSSEVIGVGIQLTATWKTFFVNNLIPVTLGNIVGGALFVALPYLSVNWRKRTSAV